MPLDHAGTHEKAFDAMRGAILDRDAARLAGLFHDMATSGNKALPAAVSTVMEAEAPYIQVPNHINLRDGALFLVNNDHTILGLRSSVDLMPYLPEAYRMLPVMQAVWYVPAGLDIWNQLLGKYPGRYATMKGLHVPPPDYGPTVWIADARPIREGNTVQERLDAYMLATMTGQVERSYGMFLDLAADPDTRAQLADLIVFLGMIDVQDTVIGRKARNTGHKGIRARAITGLADFCGWDHAHGVFYAGVPDMAVGPQYYSLYDMVCVMLAGAFPDGGKSLPETNRTELTAEQVEAFIPLVVDGEQQDLFDQITAFLKAGVSIRSIGDALQIATTELSLRNTVARAYTDVIHPADYCGTGNWWLRATKNPYQVRVLYLMANFINDTARSNNWRENVLARELGGVRVANADPAAMLRELDEAIMAFDVPRATALAHAYLDSGADRRAYMEAVAVTGCKFQDDPHHQKTLHTHFQEYENNSTHLRDRLLLAPIRTLAGWPKMPGERECYARFMSDWVGR
jgi:hypothetical protein